jgi:hypothetical protein
MKKLVDRAVDDDKFGPFLREEEMREEVKALLRQTKFEENFPRKTLLGMSLLEVTSLWTVAAGQHSSTLSDGARSPQALNLVAWLHKHLSSLILIYFELDRLAKRTTGVLPPDYQNAQIGDLIANGGKLNVECETPIGTKGRAHTIPLFKLKLIADAATGVGLWYETV